MTTSESMTKLISLSSYVTRSDALCDTSSTTAAEVSRRLKATLTSRPLATYQCAIVVVRFIHYVVVRSIQCAIFVVRSIQRVVVAPSRALELN